MRNTPRYMSNSHSGVVGVWYDTERCCWRARIQYEGRRIDLGRYKTLDEARHARNIAKVLHNYPLYG
jgi:AP2 domain